MRSQLALTLASVSIALTVFAGCDGCDKKQASAPDATATAPATGSVATTAREAGSEVATAAGDAGLKHDMGNCPTAVAGAEVAITDVDGGVEVAVTGKDEPTTKTIRERAKKIVVADLNDGGAANKHDHSGSGGGTTGRCTIIMRNTQLATTEIPNGAKVTVSPHDKSELDWLRRETKERDREAKSAGAEGAGVQRMAHCPSAVDGAKTSVKDAKDGVVITVTGPADKVADIRARGKHASEIAKKGDPKKIAHSGSGTGGGSVGRCPIVLEGDTSVDVKDIDGGVEVTVKSKNDVAGLQKEAKLRALNFAAPK